jgi:hypothetical protein
MPPRWVRRVSRFSPRFSRRSARASVSLFRGGDAFPWSPQGWGLDANASSPHIEHQVVKQVSGLLAPHPPEVQRHCAEHGFGETCRTGGFAATRASDDAERPIACRYCLVLRSREVAFGHWLQDAMRFAFQVVHRSNWSSMTSRNGLGHLNRRRTSSSSSARRTAGARLA